MIKKMLKNIKDVSPRVAKNRYFLLALAFVGSLILAESASATLFHAGIPATDSSVFRYIAYAMSEGKIPYRDIFDHKGPLLYLINYMGFFINESFGVWFFELAAIFVTVIFVFKIANRFTGNPMLSIAATVISMAALPEYLEGGNLTEEYALPFIAAALYVFVDYFTSMESSPEKLFFCGFAGGCVLMLRPNMAVAWLVFPIFVFINEIRNKTGKRLLRYSSYFIAGVLVATLPFIIYYAAVGALGDMLRAYILFNMEYSQEVGIGDLLSAMRHFASPVFYLSIAVLVISLISKKMTLFNTAYLIYAVMALWSASVSGNLFAHYALVLLPVFAYPLGLLFSNFKADFFSTSTFSALLAIAIIGSWLSPTAALFKNIFTANELPEDESTDEVVDYILENTDDDERILVFGNNNYIYLRSHRFSVSKYSYQAPIIEVSDEIREEFYRDITEEKPKTLVLPYGYFNYGGMNEFLIENGYYEVVTNYKYTVYTFYEEIE